MWYIYLPYTHPPLYIYLSGKPASHPWYTHPMPATGTPTLAPGIPTHPSSAHSTGMLPCYSDDVSDVENNTVIKCGDAI